MKPLPAPLPDLLRIYRRPLLVAWALSAVINLLMLTGSIFMLQVYDRVLTSGSIPTLVVLFAIVCVIYAFLSAFDILRARIFSRLARACDAVLRAKVFSALFEPTDPAVRHLALRDLESIRTFTGSPAPATFFDLPWIAVYLLILTLLHWVYGLITLLGMIALFSLTLLTQRRTAPFVARLNSASSARQRVAADVISNAETLQALGMKGAVERRWESRHEEVLSAGEGAQDVSESIGAFSKALRLLFQSLVLAAGAMLVLEGLATAGVIVAASVISARALSPIEQTVAHWRSLTSARMAWTRLAPLLSRKVIERTALPKPAKSLEVKDLIVVAPGSREPLVRGISLSLEAGQALGVIGPSGSGKTSLAKALSGIWPAANGTIRVDGASIDQWTSDDRGTWIGYLPHNVGLIDGTPAQNITRFAAQRDDEGAYEAAKKAGALETILKLPMGFDTPLSDDGSSLSAGQRQRVGLARALYRDPFLVVLDEPNANLDAEGEVAVVSAIRSVKARGGIVIVMAHRPSAIAEVDRLLVMREGRSVAYGPRDEILKRMTVAPDRQIAAVPTLSPAVARPA